MTDCPDRRNNGVDVSHPGLCPRTSRNNKRSAPNTRRGFALLKVLFGLAVLSVLVAASLSRTAEHVMVLKAVTQDLAGHVEFEGAAVVAREVTLGAWSSAVREVDVEIDGQVVRLRLTAVAALVDINTGSEEALREVLEEVGVEGAERVAKAIAAARVAGRAWTDTRELLRLELVDLRHSMGISAAATIYSGRAKPLGRDLSFHAIGAIKINRVRSVNRMPVVERYLPDSLPR